MPNASSPAFSASSSVLGPRSAAYVVAGLIALGLSYDLMRVPVQVSDSLFEIIDAQQAPSVWAAFTDQIGGAAYLRPLRIAQIKMLFDVADGHYWLVYRGFHALLLTAALLLFVSGLHVRTWADSAAAIFALTVLTGMHTFRGLLREGFPVNHFLEIVVFCLIALNLSRARHRWWSDVAALITVVAASLVLESGLLAGVIVVLAWLVGMQGVSRRGVVAVVGFLAVYFAFRFVYLSTGMPGLEERSSGYLLRMLEPDELQREFGSNPTWFYVYNVVTSVLSVLFSDPDGGIFETARAWYLGDVPPRLYVAVVTSTLMTGLLAWVAFTRVRAREFGDGERLLVVAAGVLGANALLSYAYTKHEIISVGGTFYAVAAFVAARLSLEYLNRPGAKGRVVLVVLLAALSVGWSFRSAGAHHMLRVQAFKVRNDWARLPPTLVTDGDSARDQRAAALVRQLQQDAFAMPVPNAFRLPKWTDRWWGE